MDRSGPCQGWDGGPDALLSSVPVSQTSGEKRPASHLSRCCGRVMRGLTTSCSPGPMHRRGHHVPGPIQGKACSRGPRDPLAVHSMGCPPGCYQRCISKWGRDSQATQAAESTQLTPLQPGRFPNAVEPWGAAAAVDGRCRGRVQCPPTLEGSVHPLVPLPGCTVVSLSVWGVSVSVLLKWVSEGHSYCSLKAQGHNVLPSWSVTL